MFLLENRAAKKSIFVLIILLYFLVGEAQEKVLLFDDFWNLTLSNRKEAVYTPVWEQVDSPLLTPEDDGLGNIVLKPGRISMRTGDKGWEDYQAEIKFRLLPKVGDKLYQIALNVRCDDLNPKGKYTFCLQDDLEKGMSFQVRNDKHEVLADYEFRGTPQEILGSAWHSLRVKVIGNAVTAYLDDIEVGSILAKEISPKGNIFFSWENYQDSINEVVGEVAYVKVVKVQQEETTDIGLQIDKETMRDLWYQKTIGKNLALGKKCTLSPTPTYSLTKSQSDPWDLTDGELACKLRRDERIWWDPKSVGWYDHPFAYIGIDLEEEKSIGRVVMRVLGGLEQEMLTFPKKIEVLLSADGDNYFSVSEWQKARLEDSGYAYLPEDGRHYVYPFSFDCGNRLARYVVVKIESAGFLFLDEIAVMEGSYPSNSVSDGATRASFKLDSAIMWSEVDKLWICNNMPIYDRVLFADLRDASGRVSLVFELPEGVELVRAFRGWSEKEERVLYKEITYDDKVYGQFIVRITDPKPYESIRVLFSTDWETDVEGEAFLYAQWQDGQQERLAVPIQTYSIKPVEPPKRLHTSIAWMAENNQKNWPDFFEVYKNLGFNAVPFFPRYGIQAEWLKQAREMGFSILYNESPMHEMAYTYNDKKEIYVLNADGTRGRQVSLAYRGQYYQHEMQRVARLSEALRPDWIFFDLELFPNYKSVAKDDQQLLSRMEAEKWESVSEACILLASEMVTDITKAGKSWSSNGMEPKVGFYNVKPPRLYEGIYNFQALYPDIIDIAQPSLYVGGDVVSIGDHIRGVRKELPQSDIIPWLTAGTYGEFSSQTMRDMVLETFFNGSCGITFYSIYDFNSLDFKYTSEAIAIATKVEDIIMGGQLIRDDELSTEDVGTRLTGLKKANGESAILVSNYVDKNEKCISVSYNVSTESKIIDLDDDLVVGIITPEEPTFEVKISSAVRSKAFAIIPVN